MILLVSTSDKIQVITTGAAITHVHASFTDYNGTAVTPSRTNTIINSAATTDVVAAPGASVQRNIKVLTIRNTDASASNTVTVQHTDGTNVIQLMKYTLLTGEELQYHDALGFMVIDINGGRKVAASTGRYLLTTVLTSGTSFTTSPATNVIFVRLVGGGGGGGGCTSVASAAAAAGGGGGGGYAEKTFTVTPNTLYTYAVGGAGNGASGIAGGSGTASTFAVGATTVTANGGGGGPQAVAVTVIGTGYLGGAGAAISTSGDVNGAGHPGGSGVMTTIGPLGFSGNGGSSPFGAGGRGLIAAANGNPGIGFGAGGSGSMTGASAVRTGGNGTAGVIVVDEYA